MCCIQCCNVSEVLVKTKVLAISILGNFLFSRVLTKLECVSRRTEPEPRIAGAHAAHPRVRRAAARRTVPVAPAGAPPGVHGASFSAQGARLSEHFFPHLPCFCFFCFRTPPPLLSYLASLLTHALPCCFWTPLPDARRSPVSGHPLAFSSTRARLSEHSSRRPSRRLLAFSVTPTHPMPTSAACDTTTSTTMPNAPSPTPSAVPLSSSSSSEPPPGWRSKHNRRPNVPHHRLRVYLPATPGAARVSSLPDESVGRSVCPL